MQHAGENLGWEYYEHGPKTVDEPLFMFPPMHGTASCYYQQLMALAAKGYRLIAVGW